MKRVIYRITDYHSDFSYIDYDKCIEAYDDEGNRIENFNNCFYTKKAEIIVSLIEKYADKLAAFGSDRNGGVSQNRPFVIEKENSVKEYDGDLFNFSDDIIKQTIIGIKGLCGMIRGIIKYPDENGEDIDVSLEIRSRFDKPGKPWFLYTMIAEAVEGTDAGEKTGSAVFDNDKDSAVDIMSLMTVFMFSQQLKRAYKSGIYRTYVKHEYNNDRPCGAIDIARHIRLNISSGSSAIAYNTRERCEDNKLNRLIAHAWNSLRQHYPMAAAFVTDNDPEFQKAIGEIITLTRDSMKDIRGCISANTQPITSPFYIDYDDLRIHCLQILSEDADSEFYTESGVDSCMSVLFYIPDLWEMYLERHLRMKLKDNIELIAQDRSIYGIRPDFVFYRNNTPFYILDAKFKVYKAEYQKESDRKYHIYPGLDMFILEREKSEAEKDIDKLIRDIQRFSTVNGALIFPYTKTQDNNSTKRKENDLKKKGIENAVIHNRDDNKQLDIDKIDDYNISCFPVSIPETSVYNKWAEDFNNSINNSVDTVLLKLSCL